MKQTILFVDDEVDNVDALERLFRKKYECLKATSGKEALKVLKDKEVAVIISDQRMPSMTGVEFLEKTLDSHPDTVRMLLTGYTDIESVIAAINSGQVYRYITKPWDPRDLDVAVSRAVERYEMVKEIKEKNIELAKANEELQSLDKAKSQFMILINHELKTPLTTLISFLGLLKEEKLTDDQSLYVEKMDVGADRLKEIIFDVLELMKAETGQLKISKKSVDIRKTIEHCDPTIMARKEEKKQEIVFDLELASIKADQEILSKILCRILHNAVKFGSEKSEIQVYSKKLDKAVEVGIRNSGSKLDKKTIDRILKPFSLDENVMNHSEGLGLGLSLCQALLKAHGSELQIESSKNTVTVSFSI